MDLREDVLRKICRTNQAADQKHGIVSEIVNSQAVRKSAGCTKQDAEVPRQFFEISEGEQYPCQQEYEACIQSAEPGGRLFQMLQEEDLLNDQDDPVEQSPQNEIPGCPMPHTGQEPYDQDVEDLTGKTAAVAS